MGPFPPPRSDGGHRRVGKTAHDGEIVTWQELRQCTGGPRKPAQCRHKVTKCGGRAAPPCSGWSKRVGWRKVIVNSAEEEAVPQREVR